jgi:tetratricopeptide (TPR) repeat protein
MSRFMLAALAVASALGGCRAQEPATSTRPPAAVQAATARWPSRQATSLLGRPLYAMPLDPDTMVRRGRELAQAQADFREDPLDEGNIIWFGRRLAYLGRYKQAIAVYSDGLDVHPDSYKLLRHRGHRYITIRRFDDAIADLSRAAALIEGVPDEDEADGLPNARNIPTSTSHTNIYYHLGLAHYVKGELASAGDAYHRCLTFAANDDMRCATIYWLYLTLRRLGHDDEAAAALEPVTANMDIIENFAYHKLLLLFKGELSLDEVLQRQDPASPVGAAIDDATLGYGIGAWHLVNGQLEEAYEVFHAIVEGETWPAFGHIAAEAELAGFVVQADSAGLLDAPRAHATIAG